jgi:hypothetical protein
VLTPNAELGAALSDAVERAHRQAGRELWPTPKILDFGTWLRAQHLERQLRDSSLPRCLSDAEERELWRGVVLESAASAQFLEPSGAGGEVWGEGRGGSSRATPLGTDPRPTPPAPCDLRVRHSARRNQRLRH